MMNCQVIFTSRVKRFAEVSNPTTDFTVTGPPSRCPVIREPHSRFGNGMVLTQSQGRTA